MHEVRHSGTPAPKPDPKLPEGVTTSTLLADGEFRAEVTVSALRNPAGRTRASAIAYGHSNSGMFWDEILTVVEKDIEGKGLKDRVVSASGVTLADGVIIPSSGTIAANVSYKGIPGEFTCSSKTTCASTGKTLGAGWYFKPTGLGLTARWKPKSDSSGTYEQSDTATADPYAEWGYWIVTTGTPKASTVHRLAGVNNNGSNLNLVEHPVASNNKATYAGKAHGVSVMGNNAGDFTADASLTATFKGAAGTELEGMISGFEGHAVNTAWELKLKKGTLDSGLAAGKTSGGANVKEGDWAGTLYGKDTERPMGVVGNFDGYFTDGQVTGVYHADNK